ncbi:PREDICTED: pectinesterase inhibitor [Tarenaya hassleriana]|uniref:pectinesterase inhibitor n=1 Tax=Tarenaya hassleriana TaxID=28532 RepID=UPI00053C4398|nr:PREDICTED: pectinesterase inhibitor [Tarenaya hassleriana]
MACHLRMNRKLVFISLLIISPISVKELGARADEQLMIKECHNANVPTTCMQCLKSDPTSPQADPVGIARIIVKCLQTNLDVLSMNITSIASKEGEGGIKAALEECNKQFPETRKDLSEADNGLKEGKYDEAAHSIIEGIQNPVTCQTTLQKLQFQGSPEVYYYINLLKELADAAMRIIDRL